eukprot:16447914-Heterocapsa_arctica.AAC.1
MHLLSLLLPLLLLQLRKHRGRPVPGLDRDAAADRLVTAALLADEPGALGGQEGRRCPGLRRPGARGAHACCPQGGSGIRSWLLRRRRA